jgi:hypothetical protein
MNKDKLQFFKGAAITARYGLPRLSPKVLNDDVAMFAALSAKHDPVGSEIQILDQTTSIACAWLDERRRQSARPIDPEQLFGSIHLYGSHPSIRAASSYSDRNKQTLRQQVVHFASERSAVLSFRFETRSR